MKLLYLVILLILSVSVSASASKHFTPPSSSSDDKNYDEKEENDDDDDADEDEDEEDKVKEDNLPVKIPAQEETIAYDDPQYSEAEEAQDEAGRPLGELAGQPALQCYQCNSLEDGKACSGSKEVLLANAAKFLKGCPPLPKNNGSSVMVVAAVGCWKLSQKVDYSQGPGLSAHYRVIRRCAYLGQEEASCASRTGYGTSTTQCFCSSSRCNGAPAVSFGGGNGGLMVITVALGSSLLLHLLST